MIEINLLPKQYRRKAGLRLEKEFAIALLITLGVFMVMALTTVVQKAMLSRLHGSVAEARAEAELSRAEIEKVEEIEKLKTALLKRAQIIRELDQRRSLWVDIMSDLARRVPDYTWLSSVRPPSAASSSDPRARTSGQEQEVTARQTVLEGYSTSLLSLATFLSNLRRSPHFHDPQLKFARMQVTEEGGASAYFFQITCALSDGVTGKPVASLLAESGSSF